MEKQVDWYQVARNYLRVFKLTEAQERQWFNTPHAELNGQTPLSVITYGNGQIVCDWLAAAIDGQPD